MSGSVTGLTYGPDWYAFRRWYFTRWWLRKRCFWCRRKPHPVTALQLNHLNYTRGDRPGWWQVRPMCRRCHRVETTLVRWLRPRLSPRRRRRAHYLVTFGVRWVGNLAVDLPLLILTHRVWVTGIRILLGLS